MIFLPLESRPRPTQLDIKKAIAKFDRKGESGPHKQSDRLLPHVINHCINRGVGFDLKFRPDEGYTVKRVGKPNE